MTYPIFRPVADFALLVELSDEVSDQTNEHIIALDRAITDAGINGVLETTPALVNILVLFDPIVTDFAKVRGAVESLLPLATVTKRAGKRHVLNACYELEIAPDLPAVAERCGMTIEEVVNFHSKAEFTVGMYGFVPGFAYLMGLPKEIQVPRKSQAVPDVASGNIIIAGAQCIVTTLNMPSGWNIIGKSDAHILGDDPEKGFLFNVGDTVTFKRVSLDELEWTA